MEKGNISGVLQSPGLLAKKPIIGILMFVIGSLIFIILAYSLVTHGILMKWDLPIAEYFHNIALKSSPLVINIMIAGYYIGKEGIVFIAILLGLYYLYKRFWKEFVMVAVGFGGGTIIFEILSLSFKRSRPFLLFKEQIWPGSPNIPGFPSGHTISIVICIGFLIYLFVPKIKSYLGKTLVIIAGLSIMFYIGFSRLYIGDHYLTDLISGYAVGVAWFGLAYTSVELYLKKRYERKEKNKKRGIHK